MTSTLACIGLGITTQDEYRTLVRMALVDAELLGRAGDRRVLRWQDPSGARLVVTLEGSGGVVAVEPSFAGAPGAQLAEVVPVNADVCRAEVWSDGHHVTSLAASLDQHALLDPAQPVRAAAGVAALGVDVQVFPDDAAFCADPASLVNPEAAPTEPPAEFREKGWPWPPRLGPESFISFGVFAAHGVFAEPEKADAHARLTGTVLHAQTRRTAATGQEFHVVRVRTAGFESDVCLAATDHPVLPHPGAVVTGISYLTAHLAEPIVPGLARSAGAVTTEPAARDRRRLWRR